MSRVWFTFRYWIDMDMILIPVDNIKRFLDHNEAYHVVVFSSAHILSKDLAQTFSFRSIYMGRFYDEQDASFLVHSENYYMVDNAKPNVFIGDKKSDG